MFAFSAIWFATVAAKEGSLLIATLISCRVFKRSGLLPTREDIARSTYCVFAMTVLLLIGLAVGTLGSPEKVGEIIFAFV